MKQLTNVLVITLMLLVSVPSMAAIRKKKKKTPANRSASAPPNTKRPPVGRGTAMEPANPTKEPPVASSSRPMSDQMPQSQAPVLAAGLRFGDANNNCTGKGICSMSGFVQSGEPNVYVVTIEPGNPPYVPTTSMAITLDDAQLERMRASNAELYVMLTTQATYRPSSPNNMCKITDQGLLQAVWPTVQGLRAATIMFNQPFPVTQNRDGNNMITSVTIKLPTIQMIVN